MKSEKDVQKILKQLDVVVRDYGERIRVLEEKTEQMFKKIIEINKTLEIIKKQLREEILNLRNKFTELDQKIYSLEEEVRKNLSKIERAATIDQVKKLESYLTIFNPLYGITEYDIKKIVREEVEKILKEKNGKG